jgi:hypothetical protein
MHTTKQQPQLHQKPPQALYQNNSSYRNYFDTGFEVVFDGVEIVVW